MRESNPIHRLPGRCRLLYVVPIILIGPADAATVDWVGHDVLRPPVHIYDGTFGDAVNWSTRAVPGPADVADFNAAAAYSVTFANDVTNLGLLVPAGAVTFTNSGPRIYTVGSATVGGNLTLSSTGLNDFYLADTGNLTIAGSGSTLSVAGGGLLTMGNAAIGDPRGGHGTLTLSGAGSQAIQSGAATLTIGGSLLLTASTINVDAGAAYTTGTGAVTVNPQGRINLTGGTFNAFGNTTVTGAIQGDATSTFTIEPGQTLTLQGGGTADLGTLNASSAVINITDSGSRLSTSQPLVLNAGGQINISGGTLITPNAVTIGTKGSIAVNTSGTFDVHGNVSVNGGSLTGSNGTIQLNPGSSLAVSNGGTVQTAGTVWSVHGAPITVNNSQFNVDTPLTLGAGNTDSLTLNNADANLSDLHLADGQVPGTATVQVSGNFLAGNLFIGTGGLPGQAATVTLSSGGEANKIQIGAATNSTGTLGISHFLLLRSMTVNATGLLQMTGAYLDDYFGLTVNGGTVRSDAATTVQMGFTTADGPVTVENGGTADLGGLLDTVGAPVVADGAGSHLNIGTALTVNGPLTYQNGATGSLPGGLVLQSSINDPPITAVATVASGAQVTAGAVTLAYDANTGIGSQLTVTGANSSLTQSADASLSVQRGSMLSVQNAGTFIGGGAATVDAGGTIQVQGGAYRANGDMTINGILQQDSAGTFILASGRTLTLQAGATADIDGSFTGGNVVNNASLSINGGNTSIQSLDGTGTTTLAAGAHLAADHIRQGALTLAGNVAVRPQPAANLAAAASSVNALTISFPGQLDLSDNRLDISYAPGQSPILAVRAELASGYSNGAWNGPGIVTSSGDNSHALGYADSADNIVAGLSPNTVTVQFAGVGDANLDGQVGFADLVALARNYGKSNANWDQGDFNYDGNVGFDDLVLLARNYGQSLTAAQLGMLSPSFRADADAAVAQVPDPRASLVVPALALGFRRCRRRQKV